MDVPASQVATGGTDAAPAGPVSDESPAAQTLLSASENQASTHMNTSALNHDDDSASDVSMSAETDDEEDGAPHTSAIQVNPDIQVLDQPASSGAIEPVPVGDGSNKRKYPASLEDSPNGLPAEVRKRLKPDEPLQNYRSPEGKLPRDKSLLPAEIWHHIFTFIPPRSLGLLLSVNRSFHAYLDPSSSDRSITPLPRSVAQILKPDAIWRASRRLFRPGIPAPLNGKSELDMWKLACSSSCQFCGRKKQPNGTVPMDQWHPGPGENGIAPVWAFGIRTCGSCLQQRSSKEIDLLLSSTVPSPLMAALPFVFLTNELHVLPLTTLQNGQPPPSIQITKNFFQPQIEAITREFSEVKSMGSAAAEEWIKGLDDRGKERRNDSARWERWEASGGVGRMRIAEPQEASKPTIQPSNSTPTATTPNFAKGPAVTNGRVPVFQDQNPNQMPMKVLPQVPQLTLPPHAISTSLPRFDSPSQAGFAAYTPRSAHPAPKHERTKEEVAELKAARRAEIERRCMLLDPPLTANVLAHMPSFQAAIQIIQPLDDSAWQVLEPRLISQRHDAEQREKERLAQTRVVQERFDDVQPRSDSRDLLDREWEDIQAPLRTRIGGYADETIRDAWAGGDKVTKDNCPAFAAEVLMYVRKRFYAEVAKDEAAIRATGREPETDPPNGPFTRKLTLENMKWVFDTKIKPHTEQYRKELFLCSECENNFKFYGFEGVIQHYAAKHTNELSVGSIVVHWKSEWPEYPPFNPEPLSSKPSYYAAPPSASIPYPVNAPQQSYGYGAYQPAPVSAPMPGPNPHGYQEGPAPYYGHPQFGDQYSGHQNGAYAPPQPYPEASQSYQAPQYSVPPVGNNLGYNEPPQDYSQQGFGGQYPATSDGYYNSSHAGPLYPASAPEAVAQQPSYAQGSQYGYPYAQPPVQAPALPANHFTPSPQRTEAYKAQLQEVAKSAREVWDSINNIKDIPGSVKVYTIIYHVLKRSRAKFSEDPPLSMIVDGLSSNKDMRKVRNINGLLCKACSLGMAGSSSAPQKKHFSFPQLVNHFYSVHEQGVSQSDPGHVPDWTKDMVDLPDLSRLASVLNRPGTNEQKLKLIGEALPEIFSAPQQSTNGNHMGQSQSYTDNVEREPYALAPSRDNHEQYYSAVDSGRQSESGNQTYDNGQYDPRNPRDSRELQTSENHQPRYRVLRRAEDYYPTSYENQPERSYIEPRAVSPPSQKRPIDGYSRGIVREEAPSYLDQQIRYRDEGDVEYRVRREAATPSYGPSEADHRLANPRPYRSNRHDVPTSTIPEHPPQDTRYVPAEDAVAQQNRIYEVVAQITQQAKQARERKPIKEEPLDGGSEDGELQARSGSKPTDLARVPPFNEASNAAERFLNECQPGEASQEVSKKTGDLEGHPVRNDNGRVDDMQRAYQPLAETHRRTRDGYEDDDRVPASRGRTVMDDDAHNAYIIRERAPQLRHSSGYAYGDRYVSSVPEPGIVRDRSPELVDRRFKLNNVVYREERQNSMRRTPSRYARYESVRLENDRARSRSPVYVKMAPQPGQYRERSPVAHPSHQEPLYGSRMSLPPAENVTYDRAPRQEYYRVYADEPRPRQPQYIETYEYVQVSDPQGDYMIRRPVRREREPEPVYTTYEDEQYTRAPVYESRPPVSRSDPAYYEEYDPRHPAPPPTAAPIRQRYQ